MAVAIAKAGVTSRRKAEDLIKQGLVEVNGNTVINLATQVNPVTDQIRIAGKILETETKIYIVLNKPPGYISSVADTHGRRTVIDLLPEIRERVFPVGRLDYDTGGLLLLTNDGDFANLMTHPRYQVKKVYHAVVNGKPGLNDIKRLEKGILLEDGMAVANKAAVLRYGNNQTLVEIQLQEGRKRQVKRMLKAIGYPVSSLQRVRFSFLSLEGLKSGEYRLLRDNEVEDLKQEVHSRIGG